MSAQVKLRIPQDSKPENEAVRRFYYSILQQLDQGLYEDVVGFIREIRLLEAPSVLEEACRRLFSARLSLLKGFPLSSTELLGIRVPGHEWVEAEAQFVLGNHFVRTEGFVEAAFHYGKAMALFQQLGIADRELLAAYNGFICRLNARMIDDIPTQLAELQRLENLARANGNDKILACVLRQRGTAFHFTKRLNAALEELLESASLFEKTGPLADYQLCLLQAADVCLDLGDLAQARRHFEFVVPTGEVRVVFPYAFVESRFSGCQPKLSDFDHIPQYWRERYQEVFRVSIPEKEAVRECSWNLVDGRWTDSEKSVLLKSISLEGKLIQILMKHKCTKPQLAEVLWPEQSHALHLDNRLHRLISRVNAKLGGDVIEFDGKTYALGCQVVLV